MNPLYTQLQKRKEYLLSLQSKITADLAILPEGKLRIATVHGNPYYYHRKTPSDRQGTYIPRKHQALAGNLAQKDYLQKLYIEICRELASIENYLSSCTCNSLEKIYSDMTPPRRSLITPLAVPDEIRITNG